MDELFVSEKFLEHPKAMNCVLDGNPLHKEQIETIRVLGRTLAINTVIDDKRRLSFVNFGEIEVSHKTYYQTIKGFVGAINQNRVLIALRLFVTIPVPLYTV